MPAEERDPIDMIEPAGAVELLRQRERELREVYALARLGTWDWDLGQPRVHWSDEVCEIFGQPAGFSPTYDEFLALIHGEDRAAVDARVQDIGASVESDSECRILRPDGEIRHVHIRRFGRTDADGSVTQLFGTVQDITERKHAEQQVRDRERQLADAQALAHFGSWEMDLTTDRLQWSDEMCRIAGAPLGSTPTYAEFMALVHPDDRRALEERVRAARQSLFSDTEYRIARPDGEIRYVHTRRYGRTDASGTLTHLWGTTQDVTERKEIELELRRARDHSEAIIAAMSEGYALTVGGAITAVNDALCRLTGFSREELIGASAPFPFWAPELLTETIELRDRVVGEGGGTFEISVMRKDGSRFEAEITAHPARNPDGTRLGFVNTFRDISERKRHEAELQRLARHDALTGLANHGVFHEQLEAEVARARRRNRPLSLAIIDIDHFKGINDRHGHLVGDDVLREVADRLAGLAREGEMLARVGGEEFAWILPDADATGAYAAAERARHAIGAAPIAPAGRVTVSVGVCELGSAEHAKELYELADRALYASKRDGRDRTSRYGVEAGPAQST
jgi:diguanylate cyclase (GGDEF)-like protein/PAS domain S-box-containing protein